AQADLYGFFFRRPKKRVQILLVEEDATETWDEPVNGANAENTLASFARVDSGELPQPPPAWKCRLCDFRASCPISQATERAACHVDQALFPRPPNRRKARAHPVVGRCHVLGFSLAPSGREAPACRPQVLVPLHAGVHRQSCEP